MNVLLDQGTPLPLRERLHSHEVSTVHEMAWSSLQNGILLANAEAVGFDVLVTTDPQLKPPQDRRGQAVAVVALLSASWPKIQAKLPEILAAIERSSPGSHAEVEI